MDANQTKPAAFYTGYVRDSSGNVFVQKQADNQFGFALFDDDQEFGGGVAIGRWTAIDESEVSDADQDRLGWLLD